MVTEDEAQVMVKQAVNHIRNEVVFYGSTTSLLFEMWVDECTPTEWLKKAVAQELRLDQ